MNVKTLKVISYDDLGLNQNELDTFCGMHEATNDSYIRFYPYSGDQYETDLEIKFKKKIREHLVKHNVIEKLGKEFFHILIHFNW